MAEKIQTEAKLVNAELTNLQSRISALPRLEKLLSRQNETILAENIISWAQTLCQLITTDGNAAAVEVLSVMLSQACQVPSISREISTKFIPSVLDDFLKNTEKGEVVIHAIEALLKSYPSSCGNLRTHVVKTMVTLMVSSDHDELIEFAARCWALGSFLGNGGHQRSNHGQQWLGQFMDCIAAIRFALDCFLGDEDVMDSSTGSFSMTFDPLPDKEPERSDAIIKRITVACRCLTSLMKLDCPLRLPFPVHTIMRVILQILDIVPSQMGNTTEMIYRAENLPEIHENILLVFNMLTKICRRTLCRYSLDTNNTFSALLDLWKDKSPVHGRDKKYCAIREKVYEALADWIMNCGPPTRFMCGKSILNRNFLQHIVDDVKPIVGTTVVTSKLNRGGRSQKAKRRRLAEATDIMIRNQVEQIINQRANSFLSSAALKVVIATFSTMGHRLPDEIVQSFQNEVISILLRLHTSEEIIPYHRCAGSRLLLYKALSSFVLCATVAPPTDIAVQIFTTATSQEGSPEIRVLSQNAIDSLNNIVRPWRHSEQTYVHTKYTDSAAVHGTAPLMEPMNVVEEDDGEDMEDAEEQIDQQLPQRPESKDVIDLTQEDTETDFKEENKENIHLSKDNDSHAINTEETLVDSPIKVTLAVVNDTLNEKECVQLANMEKSVELSTDIVPIMKSSAAQDDLEDCDAELQEMMNHFVDAPPDE